MYTQYDDKGKIFTPIVTKKPVVVTIQTVSHLIHGSIHIKPEERIKDMFKSEGPFLAVTNAEVYGSDGKILYKSHFLTLNQEQIIWLVPDEELIVDGS
jgi:hypothetical protein